MNKRILMLSICSLLCAIVCARSTYIASERGVVGDGKTLNTNRIQELIDELNAKGGGVLRFTPGVYRSGCIVLKSNVGLEIQRGAVISGSTNPSHYQSLIASEAGDNSTLALIVANGAKNISITGDGLIDGNGRQLALTIDSLLNVPSAEHPTGPKERKRANEPLRPKLFFISNCESINIDGLHLKNSACWGLSFHSCENITIHGIDFLNRAYWNNDGIDITDCKKVDISRCKINSADDGICLKSYDPTSCTEDVTISDCEVRSSASAVKFGTASWGGFKNVTVKNIRVIDTFRSAIALECVDGGTMDNILIENIYATNTGNPIFIRLGQRNGKTASQLHNITIRKVFAEMPFGVPDINYDLRGPGFSVYNPRPSSITGIPGHPVENVTLEDVEIVYPGRASKGIYYYPLNQIHQVPERIKDYPEFSMFGELPSWGFYVRHVNGLTMKNIRLSLKEDDFRPAFIFDDVDGITLDKVSLPILTSGIPYYAIDSKFIKNSLDENQK
jgi:hypothetical protein